MNSLVIRKLRLDGNLILAPMSGVTNLPSRLLCRKYGASLVYSEMTSSEAVVRQNLRSIERGSSCEGERPMGIQLMGSVPSSMLESALILQDRHRPELIDINLGCPAQSVIKNGCGSELLRKPELIGQIVKSLSDSLDIPVTAKIRILGDIDETLRIARIIEKSGADAITVHGRTQKQGYSGKCNLDFIKKIKSELSIPVIANGDVFDEKTAKQIIEYTNCDGLMIGRAAIGNPFIFRKISHFLKTGEILPNQKIEEKLADFFEYMELCRKYGMLTYNDIKRNAQWFTKGMENVKPIRVKINQTEDIDSIIGILKEIHSS